MHPRRPLAALATGLGLLALPGCGGRADAGEALQVGVAANFARTCDRLIERFTAETGIEVVPLASSTGKLCALVRHGLPLDVLLAADAEHPQRLVEEGLAVADSRFAYATGRLALCGRDATAEELLARLRDGRFEHLAIASPETAPYGVAARRALEQLGLWSAVEPRVVYGESVGQAWQFVDSGAADLGLVALSQVLAASGGARAHWLVPEELHEPIRQEAVLLARARDSAAARAWLAFLRREPARTLIEEAGYGPGDAP